MDKVFPSIIDNLYNLNIKSLGLQIIWSLISREMKTIIVTKSMRHIQVQYCSSLIKNNSYNSYDFKGIFESP